MCDKKDIIWRIIENTEIIKSLESSFMATNVYVIERLVYDVFVFHMDGFSLDFLSDWELKGLPYGIYNKILIWCVSQLLE